MQGAELRTHKKALLDLPPTWTIGLFSTLSQQPSSPLALIFLHSTTALSFPNSLKMLILIGPVANPLTMLQYYARRIGQSVMYVDC